MALIIVESPTKARTFNYILKSKNLEDKNNYFVFASMGHIRDLPKSKIAVDYEKDFKPELEPILNKEKVITQLKKLAAENQEIILATDQDREGEAISYHIAYILGYINEDWPNIGFKEGVNLKRIVFHEITPKALAEALASPETLRLDLVKAQMARRILDRVVGYELSPLLWKKTGKNWLSAGRVQTVALRLIVEREKEIKIFKSEEYFQILGSFENDLKARLISKDSIQYEQKTTLKLFAGEYVYTKTTINKVNVEPIKQDCLSDKFKVLNVEESINSKYPMPPYTTSLLQQDAYYKHGFSSKQTMRLAQDLYERGLITYHRTDSFNLSARFVFPAKEYIEKRGISNNSIKNWRIGFIEEEWRKLQNFLEGQGFTKEDIKSITSLGGNSLFNSLNLLVKNDIVNVKKKGKRSYYNLNLANSYSKKIVEIADLERRELNAMDIKITIMLREYVRKIVDLIEVKNIYIFGSIVKNSYSEKSDIDIAIIVNSKLSIKERVELEKVGESIEKRFGREIQQHIFTIEEFEGKNKLIEQIHRDGIKLI